LKNGYSNILIEINNECDIRYDHNILQPENVSKLIKRVQKMSDNKLLVSTSFKGNKVPTENVIASSDFILLHGNGINNPSGITTLIEKVKRADTYNKKPILFNEDDHYDFNKEHNNLNAAIESYASWGYFDFRREDENYESGFQSVPVDWKINSDRKKQFFSKIKEITGY